MLTSSARQTELAVIASEVKRLWYGALFIIIDVSFDGIDFVPDIVGMVLVLIACVRLRSLAPEDELGRAATALAAVTTVLTAIMVVPELRNEVPYITTLTGALQSIGVTVMAFYLHRLTRSRYLERAANRWLLAARVGLVEVAGVAVLVGSIFLLDTQVSWVDDWQDFEGVGLVAVVMVTILGVMVTILGIAAGVLWTRAAFTTWKTAEADTGAGFY